MKRDKIAFILRFSIYLTGPLWVSLLCLPFGGLKNSIKVFISAFLIMIIIKSLKGFRGLDIKKRYIPLINLMKNYQGIIKILLILLLILAPFITSNYFIDILTLTGIYIILAMGLNVMVGYTGLLNLGYAAFYAIGAYSYALLNTISGINFWYAMPFALFMTTVAGFILAIPALRLRGDYLAIVTLGFGEITRIVLNNWDSLTNGPNGISGISRPSIAGIELSNVTSYYYFVLVFVFLSAIIIRRVIESGTGRAWIAIREDEIAASTMGINTFLYKLYSFAFGALWAGVAGVLFASKMRFISPESFTFMESVMILSMVILGGQGSISGSIIGATILVLLPELLRGLENIRMLILGAGLIFMMVFRPQGIMGRKV